MEYKPSYTDSLRADIQPSYSDSLYHHGILGMHWGVRRYQNKDGSLTPEGKKHYGSDGKKSGYKFGDFTRNAFGGLISNAVNKHNEHVREQEAENREKINAYENQRKQMIEDANTWDDIIERPSDEDSKFSERYDNAVKDYYDCYDKYGFDHPKTKAAYSKAEDLAYKFGYDTGKKSAKKFGDKYDSETLNRVIDESLEEYMSRKEIKAMKDDYVEKFATWNGLYEQYHF